MLDEEFFIAEQRDQAGNRIRFSESSRSPSGDHPNLRVLVLHAVKERLQRGGGIPFLVGQGAKGKFANVVTLAESRQFSVRFIAFELLEREDRDGLCRQRRH